MSTSKGTKRDIFWRITIAYICVMLFGVAILWRVFQLQNVEGDYWRAMSDSLTTKYFTVEAERGNIYSTDGRLMATSLPVFEVRMDLRAEGLTDERFYKNVKQLGASLAQLFGDKSAAEYTNGLINARKNRSRYHLIRNNVSYTQMLKLKKFPLFELGQHKGGVIIIQKNKRLYPYEVLAKRTIGYVRENNVQPVGLEGQFNQHLTGEPGKRLMQKVSGGNWIPLNDDNEIESRNGRDVYTTIDISLQDIAENALEKTLIKNNANHGCAIVMEVATGKIRALANLGKMENGKYGETFNYAVGEALEPGSTFKLASMLALIEDGYVTPDDIVDVEYGRKQFFTQIMKDSEAHNKTKVTIKECFAISSNVGISKLVAQCYAKNPEGYLEHLRKMQLDQKTGIEVPGESKPYIKNTKDKHWSRVSLPWMSVGYETNISPLRMLTVYAAVANNGTMM
ncbi:MAG TPA: penicillin-binding transpeptidase domain-containing protein, partial [Chitinophagales bacterium]|nr:penicillin-binding transpeptidase domain-containing protein [Chitinophagales bacterium]